MDMTHRQMYPEQYAHPLVGKRVEVCAHLSDPTHVIVAGVVYRVIPGSRFGTMVQLEHQRADNIYWLLAHCKPTKEQ